MHADGTVIALDVTVVGSGDAAKEMIRRKTIGWGSLGALEKARRARADTWERVRRAQEDGVMGRREAEEARQGAATLVQQAWSGGYKRACVTFMHAVSLLMPSTCFIACLLFAWTNFHVSFAILAVAPLAHGDDMRWNPNDNGIDFNP